MPFIADRFRKCRAPSFAIICRNVSKSLMPRALMKPVLEFRAGAGEVPVRRRYAGRAADARPGQEGVGRRA